MQRAFLIHCLSPLHAGTGQAVDLIDLPIARYKATRIPFLPGSSIKGVLRESRTPVAERPSERDSLNQDVLWSDVLTAFGPDVSKDDASEHAGAVAFGDARLLALPVRSLRGTFAYVTSPLLLRLASQDLEQVVVTEVPKLPHMPVPDERGATDRIPRALVQDEPGSVLVHTPPGKTGAAHANRVFLEDLDFVPAPNADTAAWARWLAMCAFPERTGDLASRFVVVEDDAMSFLWETSTQVDAHNRINERGTVADGQLWYEESLPPETLLIGLASATSSRRQGVERSAEQLLDVALGSGRDFLQFGGKATTGKGRARLVCIPTSAPEEVTACP